MARISVVVILALGTAISPAQTPVIVSQPQNQLVIGGSNAVFSIAATGADPGYQWYFNDTNAIVGATSPTLILTNVRAPQAGNYSVSVFNAGGKVNSSDALLTVLTVRVNPYALGTLGYDLFEGTYEKAGMTNNRTASYNPNISNLGTNPAVWTWPVNFSCVGYASDGYESVLIASNQLLACGHYGGEAGQTVTFHDTNGVPWVAIVTNTIHPIADMVIAQLSNAAPPSILIPGILPPDYTNYIAGHSLLGMPAFWLHKNTGHIDYAPIANIGDYDWYGYGTWVALHHSNYGFSGSSATSGDSGSPGFLSWSNRPVLMFATTLAGDSCGLFVSGVTNWNSLAALGLTNGMKVLDLSGYPLQPATLATTNYGYDCLFPPTNETVQVGSLATFSVIASIVGIPSPSYQWLFNGSILPGATNNTLTTASVPSNAGDYAVVISNYLGSVTTAPVTLIVLGGSSTPDGEPLPSWSIIILALGVFTVGGWFSRRQNPGRANMT